MATFDEVSAALAAAAAKVPLLAGAIIQKTTYDIAADAQVLAPFKTGNLKNSIQTEFPEPLTGIVAVHAAYGWFMEAGTAPHIIEAKPGKFLAFQGRSGSVFTSRVNHPGTKPRPYVQPAVDRRIPGLIAACGQLAQRIL